MSIEKPVAGGVVRPAWCGSHGHCRPAVIWAATVDRDGSARWFGFCAGCEGNGRKSVVLSDAEWVS